MNHLRDGIKKITDSPLANSRAFTRILLFLAGLCLGLVSLYFASTENRAAIFASYFAHPWVVLLNLLPPVFLILLLYLLIGRAWIAYAVTAVLVLGFSAANLFKLTFRNDPVMFEDLLLLREAGNMAGKYRLFLTPGMAAALLAAILGGAVLFFLARERLFLRPRLIAAGCALLLLIPLSKVYLDPTVYEVKAKNEDAINPLSATEQFVSRGFLYPFLYSIRSSFDSPPAGYDEENAKALLSAYETADIPSEKKVDLIAIQLEGYNDFTRLGAEGIAPEVYAKYHALEAEGYSGRLVTNIFAGGTVDTERCFLTGFSTLPTFRGKTNSYPWYFRSQGYYVQGAHPCYDWFYNRRNINANLGFEDYWYIENYFDPLTDGSPGVDAVLFPQIRQLYAQHRESSDAPYFSFNVTYQGHGPYSSEYLAWGDGHFTGEGFTPEEETILNNYFGSIRNTNENLDLLCQFLRDREDPVVLVVFGDHNPWLGDGGYLYERLGIDLDVSHTQGFLNYYGTRYLIWANPAAKAVLGNDFQGEGPDIGPYFLMNEVFKLCSWEGPAYLQALNGIYPQVSAFNTPTGLCLEDGEAVRSLTPRGAELAQDYTDLQYYYSKHYFGP